MFDSTIQQKVKNLPDDTNGQISNMKTRLTTINNNLDSVRSSMATAINNKGISASASDSFATLSKKIKQITVETLGGVNIDIIATTSLPTTVKNGQIVIVTDQTVNKFIFDYEEIPSGIAENNVVVRYDADTNAAEEYVAVLDKTSINLSIKSIKLYKGGTLQSFDSLYIGRNNEWVGIFGTDSGTDSGPSGQPVAEYGQDIVFYGPSGVQSTYIGAIAVCSTQYEPFEIPGTYRTRYFVNPGNSNTGVVAHMYIYHYRSNGSRVRTYHTRNSWATRTYYEESITDVQVGDYLDFILEHEKGEKDNYVEAGHVTITYNLTYI